MITEKTMGHESDGDTNCNWHARYSHQRIGTETGGLGNKRMREDYPNNSIVQISQNTKKSPGDLRGTCCHLDSSGKQPASTSAKKLSNNNNNNKKKKNSYGTLTYKRIT